MPWVLGVAQATSRSAGVVTLHTLARKVLMTFRTIDFPGFYKNYQVMSHTAASFLTASPPSQLAEGPGQQPLGPAALLTRVALVRWAACARPAPAGE